VISRHEGAEIRTEGDSFYVVFTSLGQAVTAGIEILEEAERAERHADQPIRVGIGIHAGETIDGEDGIVGSAVNIAARVCASAKPGQLLVTETVRALTRGYLPATFVPVGKRRLKGITDPLALFEVRRGAMAGVRAARIPQAVAIGGAFAAAVIVVAVVAATMAIDGWLTAADDGSSVSPPPSASGSTPSAVDALPSSSPVLDPDAPFPTVDEERLLGLLDERDRERCVRADPSDGPVYSVLLRGSEGFQSQAVSLPYVAAIDCALGGISAPDRLLYWDIRPPLGDSPLSATGDASAIVFQQAGRVGASAGGCADGIPAQEAWSFGDASGDLVCYKTTTGDAVLLWSRDGSLLLGRAVRDDRDMAALLGWWEDVARFHD